MQVGTAPDVGRLAQYRPWERGGIDLRAVLHDLVVAAAAMDDGEGGTLLDVVDLLGRMGLEVELKIRPVVDDLIESRKAERTSTGFRLSPAMLDELQAKSNESQRVEERAFREWEFGGPTARPWPVARGTRCAVR